MNGADYFEPVGETIECVECSKEVDMYCKAVGSHVLYEIYPTPYKSLNLELSAIKSEHRKKVILVPSASNTLDIFWTFEYLLDIRDYNNLLKYFYYKFFKGFELKIEEMLKVPYDIHKAYYLFSLFINNKSFDSSLIELINIFPRSTEELESINVDSLDYTSDDYLLKDGGKYIPLTDYQRFYMLETLQQTHMERQINKIRDAM